MLRLTRNLGYRLPDLAWLAVSDLVAMTAESGAVDLALARDESYFTI